MSGIFKAGREGAARTLRICALTALLCLPGVAAAQEKAVESLRGINGRAHFHLRLAELCDQPDSAQRQKLSSAMSAWLNAEASRIGVSPTLLDNAASEGAEAADRQFQTPRSVEQCEGNAGHLAGFLDHTRRARESAQRTMLRLNTRAHFQMRMAQLCKQPDEARQQAAAAAIGAALTEYALASGVSTDDLRQNAAAAATGADGDYARDSSDASCARNAASLIALSGG